MKRMLINATHAEEVRVALVSGNRLYDFDLENRTREQKKSNIYKGHVTRVEPSLEAVFVEYGANRQGFLSLREIAPNYLQGDSRQQNIRELITEGTELLVQVEKEERGNKGAALSTFISLAGRYLVLMPNNPKGGGISRQIAGDMRDELKRLLSDLNVPNGMSVIIRTAGIGRSLEDLQLDLQHLLDLWQQIQQTAKKAPSPILIHQEAGVVTRALRDYLRDDVAEILIDNEQSYNEAYNFVKMVMPRQLDKLKTYTLGEPLFAHFGVESQIQTAYEREVKLPSGGSIVIDQTEALVSIDINSAKSTRGQDVEDTAFHTNIEAAEEIARQLRLRDIGGLIVIDFIDMGKDRNQRQVEAKLREATQADRARIQFSSQLSRFGLMEMSRQRLRPSLEEATGYVCPRCHGTGVVRDLRSLSLSIMRAIEEIALHERHGEVQVQVPVEIAAFLLNEKRHSLMYLEQHTQVRVTVLPHPHMETPHYEIQYNPDGFSPTSYERTEATRSIEKDLGYESSAWHLDESHQHEANPAQASPAKAQQNRTQRPNRNQQNRENAAQAAPQRVEAASTTAGSNCAWLENLFVQKQASTSDVTRNAESAASAIEQMVNQGAVAKGQLGSVAAPTAAAARSSNAYIDPAMQNHAASAAQSNHASSQNNDSNNRRNRRRGGHQNNNTSNAQPKDQNRESTEARQTQSGVDDNQQQTAAPERKSNSERPQRNNNKQKRQQNANANQQQDNAVAKRDRNSPERSAKPVRHRDPQVLENVDSQVDVQLVNGTNKELQSTALIVDIDQQQSEIVAYQPAKTDKAAKAKSAAKADKPAAEAAKDETTAPKQSAAQRAANDPRERSRQRKKSGQKNTATTETKAPVAAVQSASLQQFTVGGLIRYVYGEDYKVLVEQFGLISTFTKALQKHQQSAVTQPVDDTDDVAASTDVVSVGNVAEDAVIPATAFGGVDTVASVASTEVEQAVEANVAAAVEATNAATTTTTRAANDPREKRRLARIAAEQPAAAAEASSSTPTETTATKSDQAAATTDEANADSIAETTVQAELGLQQPAVDTAAAPTNNTEQTVANDDAETKTAKQQAAAKENQAAASADEEDSNTKKAARPRRPRGRPPKKVATSSEE